MRKEDRREELVAAAAELIAGRGLASVRTRDVTARAGVGVGLLNHYFTWSELRAEALGRVLGQGRDRLLGLGATTPPARRDALLRAAFDAGNDPLWQVWVEAGEAARTDPALARVLEAAMVAFVADVAALIAEGAASGDWACPDPEGAAIRLLALHDGLLGHLMSGVPALTREECMAHLAHVFALECPAVR